ncbi:hypothetical protein FIV02_18410 [Pseudomonas sp. THAF187a]|uniref:hypothetical protein n=1 Tax=unclassified Pseudomonas TaxID=196821 RepID=UPI0012697521|nr:MULTISPECIES: hypothetical protein [unclassified Pseudomonas]QFT23550.1 hypothetical protein FIV02_18410 [Pseudomonas sp. THAF187a]QFT43738.1 hypothetical protein FIU98_18395 [Pseudomonas sp. THAF42]
MTVSNIERFDELTGRVLARLYAEFPLPIRLMPDKFVETSWVVDAFTGALAASADTEFFTATVDWLADAGYLRYQGLDPTKVNGFTGAVLTAKGLELLKAIPDSLGDSFGERLREAAATEGREGLRSLVSQVLGAGISLLSSQ